MANMIDVYVSPLGEYVIYADENAPRRKDGGLDARFAVNKRAIEAADDQYLAALAAERAGEKSVPVEFKDTKPEQQFQWTQCGYRLVNGRFVWVEEKVPAKKEPPR